MKLKHFNVGDYIGQKDDATIKWIVMDKNEKTIKLQRHGGHFNGAMSGFDPDTDGFVPIGKTARKIRKKEKDEYRKQKAKELLPLSPRDIIKMDTPQIEDNNETLLKPKDVAEMAGCSVPTIINAINSNSIEVNIEKYGKKNRYTISKEAAMEWSNNYNNKSQKNKKKKEQKKRRWKPDPTYVNINKNNPFYPGSRMYCFYEVLLVHGKATYRELVSGCLALSKQFQVEESIKSIKLDLNNKINHWKKGEWGLKIDVDKSNCEKTNNGRLKKGELDKMVIILKEETIKKQI